MATTLSVEERSMERSRLLAERGGYVDATGILSGVVARKFWNLSHTSVPLRISTSRESRSRGGILFCWVPSRAKVLVWQGQ